MKEIIAISTGFLLFFAMVCGAILWSEHLKSERFIACMEHLSEPALCKLISK